MEDFIYSSELSSSESRTIDLFAMTVDKTQSINIGILDQKKPSFYDDVIDGLSQTQKTLPCKYFYDKKGSQLFEDICDLQEYYVTRTELSLLNTIKTELASMIGKDAIIFEPGAGAGVKIRTLLKALNSPELYVPMDISKDFLFYSTQIIQNEFPNINIFPLQGDFTEPVKWFDRTDSHNRVVFFPGSTIGNFEKKQAIEFLSNMRELMGKEGSLIIGVDLLKDQSILEAAYNDSKGVTAAFNKNLLFRINKELDADFDLEQFKHQAYLNHQQERIEMHLISQIDQVVNINGCKISFSKFETIHTENSHKYSMESFLEIANRAKLKIVKTWLDDNRLFSVHYLVQNND